jgi:hypothetical protein
MASAVDLRAAWLPVYVDPGDGIVAGSWTVTVPSGSETGTWTANVYSDERRLTPALAAITVTGPAGLVFTLTMSSATAAGLITAGMSRFSGHWDLVRTLAGERHTWMKGLFIVDAGKGAPS